MSTIYSGLSKVVDNFSEKGSTFPKVEAHRSVEITKVKPVVFF